MSDFISIKPLNLVRLWLKHPWLQQYYMLNKQKYGVYTWIMKQKCIIQTQFDFAGDFFAQNHSTFRQGIPLRLWKRFDFGSTFKPVRLWQQDADRRTLSAAPSGPADAPQDGPSWAKCAFWVNISLNNDLANIKLTFHRILNFESCKKAQKCIKKRRRGCRKRWN